MRALYIHADSLEFSIKEKTSVAEEIPADFKGGRAEETLVCFVTVEAEDEADLDASVDGLVRETRAIAEQVKARHITLYPYAHLSDSHAAPWFARSLMVKSDEALKAAGFDVMRPPFGWYKAFTVVCKGHPLSELSRTIRPGERAPEGGKRKAAARDHVSKSLKAEAQAASRLAILDPAGGLHALDAFDFSKWPDLKSLAEYESKKDRTAQEAPAHVALMQKHELADYEEGSDSGNLKFYPAGRVVKKILERYISSVCVSAGAMEVETPVMYDFEHPSLKAYLDRFPARQYTVQSDDKQFFLRFAACFGQFLIAAKANISYRHLPMRLYELTRYSFRREQSGEVAGLRRLRAFTMPDMHTLVADLKMAKEEFLKQFELSVSTLNTFSIPFQMALRAQESFFKENREFCLTMAKRLNRPVLMELFEERYAYWVTKFELNYIDGQKKAAALSTVQIDVENADTYDIRFADAEGKAQRPLILHTSVSGAVERILYALLEEQSKKASRGEKPMYPFFLAPVQVRVIPVASSFGAFAEALAASLPGRVDVDDRDEKVGRKIRDAETEWIPMIIVVGDREVKGQTFPVRMREGGEKPLTKEALIAEIDDRLRGYPFEPLNGPSKVSLRPSFR